MTEQRPILDLRGRRALPRLAMDSYLREAPAVQARRAQHFWAAQLAESGGRLWEVTPGGEVAEVYHQPRPIVLCTFEDVIAHMLRGTPSCLSCRAGVSPDRTELTCHWCGGSIRQVDHRRLGVYESGGPTGARPGRQWLTRHPEPWLSNPYIRHRQWERPIRLCEVSPVDWPPGWGYITASWELRIEGDERVIAELGPLWRSLWPQCERCNKNALYCRHNRRRGLLPPRSVHYEQPAPGDPRTGRRISDEVTLLKKRLRAEADASTGQRLRSVGSREELAPDGCYCFTGCAPCDFCCPRSDPMSSDGV